MPPRWPRRWRGRADQPLAGRAAAGGADPLLHGQVQAHSQAGAGGGGNVFLGQHVTMNRRVALKFISRQMGKDRDSLDRFLAEAPPSPPSITPISCGPTAWITRAIATTSSWSTSTAWTCSNWSKGRAAGLWTGRRLHPAGRRGAGPRPCPQHGPWRVQPWHLLVSRQGVVKIRDVGLSRLIEGEGAARGRSRPGRAPPATWCRNRPTAAAKSIAAATSTDWVAPCIFSSTGHVPSAEAASAERGGQRQSQLSGDIRRQRPDAPAPLADLCAR